MKSFCRSISKVIATVFFIGYVPFASGTFGTLAAAALVWFFRPDNLVLSILIVAGFAAGVVSSGQAETDLREKDSRKIVVDEFVGYLISVAFLPLTAGYLVAAFFLFRFFDILKPSPIRNVERLLCGGLGIMLDDVLAGVFTNLILQIWNRL